MSLFRLHNKVYFLKWLSFLVSYLEKTRYIYYRRTAILLSITSAYPHHCYFYLDYVIDTIENKKQHGIVHPAEIHKVMPRKTIFCMFSMDVTMCHKEKSFVESALCSYFVRFSNIRLGGHINTLFL